MTLELRPDQRTLVLAAGTRAEFAALLRRIAAVSGRTGGQIAAISGLPKATVHYYLREDNKSLPRKAEFIERFCRACKLGTDQAEEVVRIWYRLGGIGVLEQTDREDHSSGVGEAEPARPAIDSSESADHPPQSVRSTVAEPKAGSPKVSSAPNSCPVCGPTPRDSASIAAAASVEMEVKPRWPPLH